MVARAFSGRKELSQFEEIWRTEQVNFKQIAWLGLLSAIVMFSRLDLIFLAVIVGIWILFRGTPIRYLLPLDILIIFISMMPESVCSSLESFESSMEGMISKFSKIE